MAPRTASTAAVIAIVSLLLRFMADPFLTRISILAPESGSISHPNSRSSEAPFFLRGLLLPLPSVKKTCERVFDVSTHVSKNETWGTRDYLGHPPTFTPCAPRSR